MGRKKYFYAVAINLACLFVLVPLVSTAQEEPDRVTERMRTQIEARIGNAESRIAALVESYCATFLQYQEKWGTRIPAFCGDDDEPTPTPPVPTLTLSSSASVLSTGEAVALSWDSEHATSCTASGGWIGEKQLDGSESISPATTTTYSLSCSGPGGTATNAITLLIISTEDDDGGEEDPPEEGEEDPPGEGEENPISHVVITEIFYDVDPAHGLEGTDEWIELYNPTQAAIDLSLYSIEDGNNVDALPEGTIIEAGAFLLITNSATTTDLWSVPESVTVISLLSPIGNGLGNSGDVLQLSNNGIPVDTVSWGNNVSAFDPAVPVVPEGSSIARISNLTDTDTAADWTENPVPNPGS